MSRKRGRFIVLEGLDGAGTTTQASRLHEHLTERGVKSLLTFEPTDEPVGKLIRDALSGRLNSPRTNRQIALSEDALCLLFLETQFLDLNAKTPEDKMIEVVRKVWQRMSEQGRAEALKITLAESERTILERALSR